MFTSNQLGLLIRTMQTWKVEDGIKWYKGAPKDKDSLGDYGPGEASWGEIVGMNVSDPLLVLMHERNHGAAGPEHDRQAASIR